LHSICIQSETSRRQEWNQARSNSARSACRLLKTGALVAGSAALGYPALVGAQAGTIKIGHLTPMTGFLGALGRVCGAGHQDGC